MDALDIPERIAVAIQARLEYVIPVVQTWHQGMALGAVQNSITTAHQLEEIVTLISGKEVRHCRRLPWNALRWVPCTWQPSCTS
jgi:hypothetical protein